MTAPATARALAGAAGRDRSQPRLGWRRLRGCPWWPWLRRAAAGAFFVLVAALLIDAARDVDWPGVIASLRRTPLPLLAGAAALAFGSHLLFSCFDLLGRAYTGHGLRRVSVMAINFVSYAFTLNLGTLIGGVALRFRLYAQRGLKPGVVARVLGLSVLTNWLGYVLLAGAVLAARAMPLPPGWAGHTAALQITGALLVACALGYVGACALARGRHVRVRGHDIRLPGLRLALLQLLLSAGNWMLIAGAIWMLLPPDVDYVSVLAVLLAAAIAGVIAHVPAGLGVLEAVFVALLGSQVPTEPLLAALLAYRGLYYVAPLLAASLLYAAFEVGAQRGRAHAGPRRQLLQRSGAADDTHRCVMRP